MTTDPLSIDTRYQTSITFFFMYFATNNTLGGCAADEYLSASNGCVSCNTTFSNDCLSCNSS